MRQRRAINLAPGEIRSNRNDSTQPDVFYKEFGTNADGGKRVTITRKGYDLTITERSQRITVIEPVNRYCEEIYSTRHMDARIDFSVIMDTVEVDEAGPDANEVAEFYEVYPHEKVQGRSCDGGGNALYAYKEVHGYFRDQGRDWFVDVNFSDVCDSTMLRALENARANGASKQVAEEAAANARRRYIQKIVDFYTLPGPECGYFTVSCDLLVHGRSFKKEVLCIDGYDYASSYEKYEVALDIGSQLTEYGYIIEGCSSYADSYRRRRKRDTLRNKMRIQDG